MSRNRTADTRGFDDAKRMFRNSAVVGALLLIMQPFAAKAEGSEDLVQLLAKIQEFADADMQRAMLETDINVSNELSRDSACRPLNLAAYRAEFEYFHTKYEFAIKKCVGEHAHIAWSTWRALDLVREAPEVMIPNLRDDNPDYTNADAGSPFRALIDASIADYLAGQPVFTTMQNAYQACAILADKDADIIEYDKSTPITGPDEDRAQDRGHIICD